MTAVSSATWGQTPSDSASKQEDEKKKAKARNAPALRPATL
jgi:hypothetical protein